LGQKRKHTGMKPTLNCLIRLAAIFSFLMLLSSCQTEKAPQTIVILRWATHPALVEVENAFTYALISSLKSNPKFADLDIKKLNANANPYRAEQLAETAVQLRPLFIVTFGTPASQAAAKVPSDIPLLFAAVSDPKGAGLYLRKNVTGIVNVDLTIVEKTLDYIKLLRPKAKTIATIYNPAEQNSLFVQQIISQACLKRNLKLEQGKISDPSQIAKTAENLAQTADVFYCANDNTVNLGIAGLSSVATASGKPFIIGELSAIEKGPTAAVGVDYTETGTELAKMAAQFLSGTPISKLPPQPPPIAKVRLNQKQCAAIHLEIPAAALKAADKLY
jgi:putative tryptophan/tyrosine transport system substrate-binding protein